jgi:hypothetical protein
MHVVRGVAPMDRRRDFTKQGTQILPKFWEKITLFFLLLGRHVEGVKFCAVISKHVSETE